MVEDIVNITETEKVKCSTCGSDMVFDPKTQSLKCEHCGNSVDIQSKDGEGERIFAGNEEDLIEWKEGRAFRCENCGATTMLEGNAISTRCPFCGAAKVVEVNEQAGIKPMGVIPFAFNKEDAKSYYTKWIKRKFFVPNKLKKNFNAKDIDGVYVPCWTFDDFTESTYSGVLGKRYTVTVGTGKNMHTETRIRYFSVSGTLSKQFDDITVEASSQISQSQYDGIAPYDTNNTRGYDSKYLAGYSAERYEIGMKEAFELAKGRMDAIIRRDIINKYNADVVQTLNVNTVHNGVTYKYILLPIWIGSYIYNSKHFNFYTNGVTGRTTGKIPYSPIKVALVVLGALAIMGAFIYLFMINQ